MESATNPAEPSGAESGVITTTTTHWALGIGLDFFMAQCPIISQEEGVPAILPFLAGKLPTFPLLADRDMAQVNLWMSVQATSTNTHYDANDNLLLVTRGSKR